MKWRPIGNHTYESDTDPVYCVLRCTASGQPTGRFIAFRGKTTAEGSPVVLGGKPDLDAVIELCKQDYAQQQTKAAA